MTVNKVNIFNCRETFLLWGALIANLWFTASPWQWRVLVTTQFGRDWPVEQEKWAKTWATRIKESCLLLLPLLVTHLLSYFGSHQLSSHEKTQNLHHPILVNNSRPEHRARDAVSSRNLNTRINLYISRRYNNKIGKSELHKERMSYASEDECMEIG